jgi:uncharacterized protein YuzE
MRIIYDREEDILMVELKPQGCIDHAEQVDSIILHLSEEDEPILLEILHASDFLAQVLKESLQPAKAIAG